jgi:hypothetical protein
VKLLYKFGVRNSNDDSGEIVLEAEQKVGRVRTYDASDLRLESEEGAEGVKGFVFVFWGVGLSFMTGV